MNTSINISKQDMAIYEFIEGYILENGYAPSHREIAEKLSMSISTVNYHVKHLRIAGLIQSPSFKLPPRAMTLPTIKMERKTELKEAVI